MGGLTCARVDIVIVTLLWNRMICPSTRLQVLTDNVPFRIAHQEYETLTYIVGIIARS